MVFTKHYAQSIKCLNLVGTVVFTGMLFGSPFAWGGQAAFENAKQVKVQKLQTRISILQDALNCINNATDKNQMRSCEETERQSLQSSGQQGAKPTSSEPPPPSQ